MAGEPVEVQIRVEGNGVRHNTSSTLTILGGAEWRKNFYHDTE